MPYTLKLDVLRHDLIVKNGNFVFVSGSDEVRQRIKVALWHELGEYFIDVRHGVPWHSKILGNKYGKSDIINIIRNAISRVPGVLKVLKLDVSHIGREYSLDSKVLVQKGKNEIGDGIVEINGVISNG